MQAKHGYPSVMEAEMRDFIDDMSSRFAVTITITAYTVCMTQVIMLKSQLHQVADETRSV
jgi:hypothetical protein